MKETDKISLSKRGEVEVQEALDKLLEVCQIHHLPMFATVVVKNSDTKTEYKNVTYGSKSHTINLTEDRIRKHILIAGGFDAVPVRDNLTLDMEEVINLGDDI